MDREIHHVVSGRIRSSEEVVKGKTEVAYISAGVELISFGDEGMNVRYGSVVPYRAEIVKLERDIECVGINSKADNHQNKERVRPFQHERITSLWGPSSQKTMKGILIDSL
jgi:hypothetical protein